MPEDNAAGRAADALRGQGESFVGSAMVRAIAALRRAQYDDEATELENVFVSLGRDAEQADVVPQQLRDSIDAYVETARPLGGFLYCVLTNDLSGAFARADDASRRSMGALVKYLREHTPTSCWGSPENVKRWYTMPEDERRTIVSLNRGYEIVDDNTDNVAGA